MIRGMFSRLFLLPVVLCLLAGCASQEPPRPMGQSVRRAMAAQYLNPEAGGVEPVAGLDGPAGQTVLKGYRDSFTPEKKEGGTDLFSAILGGGKK